SWGGSIQRVSLQAASENMATGRADVWVNMLVGGHPRTMELAHSHDLRFLGLSEEAMNNMRELGFVPSELPAGAFPGHDEGVMLPGTATLLIANEELDEEVVYAVTKALIENIDAIKQENASLRGWDLKAAADTELAGGIPL